jgi:hypothetical protein
MKQVSVQISDEYRIAAMLHSKFKLAFLQDEQAAVADIYTTNSERGGWANNFNDRRFVDRI